ncbi:ABC transporter substrate-binding protein [Cohnella sp.]|uniref:ABC transporter substrate-binding protein n=1 Tax=Cohnella sp. TaxID=1883426 RepID=UPI0035677469
MFPFQKFRIFILSLILTVCIGNVAVVAEGETTEPSVETLELSVYQTDLWDYTPLFQTYVDEINPNVKINIYSFPIWEYEDNIKIALASGDTPDLILFPNWFIPDFSSTEGLFTDMNEIDSSAVSEIRSGTVKGLWSTINPPGRKSVSFVPLNSLPSVMFYRTDLFRKAGLPTQPEAVEAKLNSWNAVASLGKIYKSKTKRALLGQPTSIFNSVIQLKTPIYYDNKNNYIGDKNPQIKKAYDYVVKGMKEGWIGKYKDFNSLENAVKSGSVGAVIGEPSIAQSIKDWVPKLAGKWAVASVPERTYDSGTLSAAIPPMKQNSGAAMELIQWLAGANAQNMAFNNFGFFPANLEALGETEWLNESDAFYGNQKVNHWYVKAAQTAKPDALYQNHSLELHSSFNNAIIRLIRNAKSDPTKEWAAAVKEAKKIAASN